MSMKPNDKYLIIDYLFILGLFILALITVIYVK